MRDFGIESTIGNKFILQSHTYSIILVFLFIAIFNGMAIPQNNSNSVFITLAGGYHFGDGRFETKPIIYAGAGYYITRGLTFEAEYVPIIVKAKNNNYPPFTYKGDELSDGEKAIIETYFLSIEGNIIHNFWLGIGIAPENLFSVKLSLNYKYVLNDHIVISPEYNFLMIGRPILNSRNLAFLSNSFTVGLSYLIF